MKIIYINKKLKLLNVFLQYIKYNLIIILISLLLFNNNILLAQNAEDKIGTPTTNNYQPQNNSINKSANDNDDANKKAGTINVVTGGILTTAGIAFCAEERCDIGQPLIMMGAMSLLQAVQNFATSDKSGNISDLTNPFGNIPNQFDPNLNDNNISTTNPDDFPIPEDLKQTKEYQSLMKGLEHLKENNFDLNPDGSITTPDGEKVDAQTFASAGGMSTLGLDESQIGQIQQKMKEAAKKAEGKLRDYAISYENGGGGKRRQLIINQEDEEDYSSLNNKNNFNKNKLPQSLLRSAASVKGMFVNYKGEKIGVSTDNIFKMIQRRYKAKEKQKAFLNY